MPLAAVTGASGHLGGRIAAALLRHGVPVRLLVRRTNAQILDFAAAGAVVVTVDFADPRSIEAARYGLPGTPMAGAAISITGPSVRRSMLAASRRLPAPRRHWGR